MQKKFLLTVLFFGLLAGSTVVSAHQGHSGGSQQVSDALWQEKMGRIINNYLKIRASLAADSLEGVDKLARDIFQLAGEIQEIIDHYAHSAHLHKFHTQIDTHAISRCADRLQWGQIEQVRKDFKLLSEQIKKYLQLFGRPDNVPGKVYIYQCSMYPGYWLQESKEVGNPYYGKKMLKCGNLVSEDGDKQEHQQHQHG